MSGTAKTGAIGWVDLTVEDAESLRDFYCEVAGWESEAVDMEGYSDFNMLARGGTPVAGICHARGSNAEIPPQWMIYITVEDLDRSVRSCEALGGEVVVAAGDGGKWGRFCVIRDPVGAVAALYEPAP